MDININEIAKKMTREEFLNCIDDNGWVALPEEFNIADLDCPSTFELKDIDDSNCVGESYAGCKYCWTEAIKDIKFKGEDVKLNQELWNKFLNGEVVVNCQTENESEEFLKYCNKQKMKWCNNDNLLEDLNYTYHKNICYKSENKYHISMYNYDNTLKVITYQQLINLTNKNHTLEEKKEYTIQEVFDFPNGTEFKCGDTETIVKIIKDDESKFLIIKDNNNPCPLTDLWLKKKFKLIEKHYFNLEGAMSISGLEGLNLKHKDWDNFIPTQDIMSNIVFLIKDNKLEIEDLNKKVWEVEE